MADRCATYAAHNGECGRQLPRRIRDTPQEFPISNRKGRVIAA